MTFCKEYFYRKESIYCYTDSRITNPPPYYNGQPEDDPPSYSEIQSSTENIEPFKASTTERADLSTINDEGLSTETDYVSHT